MKIHVGDIPEQGLRLSGTLAVPAGETDAGLPSGTVVAFAVQVECVGEQISVSGWVHSVPRLECDRCLQSFRLPVDRCFEVTYRPAVVAEAEAETELDEADLSVDYYAGDSLDLRAALAEQVLLGLPVKLLCSQDCKGLCPRCGANRNERSCDCGPTPDPRLSPLAQLRDQL